MMAAQRKVANMPRMNLNIVVPPRSRLHYGERSGIIAAG